MTPSPEDIEALDHERAARSKALMDATVCLEKIRPGGGGPLIVSGWTTNDILTLAAWVFDGTVAVDGFEMRITKRQPAWDGNNALVTAHPLYTGHTDDDVEADK